jgi:predicted nucleic acid-binding Zn finger protein
MSTEPNQPSIASQTFTLRYQQPSEFHHDHVQLFSQLQRDAVQFSGKLKQPLAFREALATLFAIVGSDYRYVPKDRTAYTAFMQMRRSNQNQSLAKAYRAYFDWLLRNDPLAYLILDPVISVHPDAVVMEVFSKDEGCYASLSFDHSFFASEGQVQYGTTNIDFSPDLAQGIEQIRSFRETQLTIGQQAVGLTSQTAEALPNSEVIEKRINVPQSWLRGFLQVQSSAQLAADVFYLKPLDLYNALRYLRLHADVKGKRRGLRIELEPKQAPRLVLEPHDVVINGSAEAYQGKVAKVVRLWGRRRLQLIKRFLPYTQSIEVRLLGNGMPSFWILRGEGMTLTVAITGFTASNWSQALNFDLLLPRRADSLATLKTVISYLQSVWVAPLSEIANHTGLEVVACRAALQQACQQGLVTYDAAHQVYRYRPLTEQPLDMSQFQFRQPAEKLAYDLLSRPNAISALTLNLIPQEGVEISATITVKEDKREYLSQLKLNEEGQVSKASCSCHQIMQHGLSQGACSHLIALRLAYAEHQAKRDVNLITQETKLFIRRHKAQEEQIQLTLDQRRLLIHREINQQAKQQQLAFNTVQAARHAYLGKIAQLETSGFIEG